ncbi:RHS repeat-associated core domain-containing protein [Burkholderia cenocepacia]|nr:RHS repeat-associated core domain-containing protein [Burkholderia cenocepacia]MCA7926128.1 RHS repeat-associated core domain-containing protein [Burkholderia cenocepacia]
MAQVPTQLDGPALNRHRYYDPSSGRFVSKYPLGLAGGINAYQYVPNPIRWIDPLGWACRRPGGYCVNDADQHGNLSPQPNLAPDNRLAGGENLQIYASSPIDWIDPFGLKYVSGIWGVSARKR